MPKIFIPIVTKNSESAPPPSQKVVIDPITRIEGHLRVEVQVQNGKVTDAWSGIELVMQGRDPRDAWIFTQRICGV